jgi:hypothetical protein
MVRGDHQHSLKRDSDHPKLHPRRQSPKGTASRAEHGAVRCPIRRLYCAPVARGETTDQAVDSTLRELKVQLVRELVSEPPQLVQWRRMLLSEPQRTGQLDLVRI